MSSFEYNSNNTNTNTNNNNKNNNNNNNSNSTTLSSSSSSSSSSHSNNLRKRQVSPPSSENIDISRLNPSDEDFQRRVEWEALQEARADTFVKALKEFFYSPRLIVFALFLTAVLFFIYKITSTSNTSNSDIHLKYRHSS